MQRNHPCYFIEFGCSPDGIITDSSTSNKGLLEVKGPFCCQIMSFEQASSSPSFCLKLDNNGLLALQQSHSYYYQIQHGLLATRLEWADFVVWSPRVVLVQRIYADAALQECMLRTLSSFYKKHLLPALFAESQQLPPVATKSDVGKKPLSPHMDCRSFDQQVELKCHFLGSRSAN